MSDAEELDVERLARTGSNSFDMRVVELAPAAVLAYDAASWQDAIVFVTAGEIEIDCLHGESGRFRRCDILCFAPFRVRSLRNAGTEPARLLVISRRTPERRTG